MENKPTNLDEVQINDAELDEVVGGKDVLDMQNMSAPIEEEGCLSWNSCTSHSSN